MMKQLTVRILQRFYALLNKTMDYLEEVDPDIKRAGLVRRKVSAVLAQYDQPLYEKRRGSNAGHSRCLLQENLTP